MESLIEDLQYLANTPYEKSAYQYIAVGVTRHLRLNADLSFLLNCTEFFIDFRK